MCQQSLLLLCLLLVLAGTAVPEAAAAADDGDSGSLPASPGSSVLVTSAQGLAYALLNATAQEMRIVGDVRCVCGCVAGRGGMRAPAQARARSAGRQPNPQHSALHLAACPIRLPPHAHTACRRCRTGGEGGSRSRRTLLWWGTAASWPSAGRCARAGSGHGVGVGWATSAHPVQCVGRAVQGVGRWTQSICRRRPVHAQQIAPPPRVLCSSELMDALEGLHASQCLLALLAVLLPASASVNRDDVCTKPWSAPRITHVRTPPPLTAAAAAAAARHVLLAHAQFSRVYLQDGVALTFKQVGAHRQGGARMLC